MSNDKAAVDAFRAKWQETFERSPSLCGNAVTAEFWFAAAEQHWRAAQVRDDLAVVKTVRSVVAPSNSEGVVAGIIIACDAIARRIAESGKE